MENENWKELKIEGSRYSILYEIGKEYNYEVLRDGEPVLAALKTNLVFDLFQDLLSKNEKLENAREILLDLVC